MLCGFLKGSSSSEGIPRVLKSVPLVFNSLHKRVLLTFLKGAKWVLKESQRGLLVIPSPGFFWDLGVNKVPGLSKRVCWVMKEFLVFLRGF